MNKAEFIAKLAENTGFTKKDASAFVDGFTSTVIEEVANGNDITFVGFGSFKSVEKEARTARNPRTGEMMHMAAKRSPKFKFGKVFKDTVAGKK